MSLATVKRSLDYFIPCPLLLHPRPLLLKEKPWTDTNDRKEYDRKINMQRYAVADDIREETVPGRTRCLLVYGRDSVDEPDQRSRKMVERDGE
ncbi:hypothetical protein VTL71DRAFT_1024 [Oculimacula yallundae]|uniref:Uncharacterized protein n=1 Tax=Oculimacula yallundae TaxID=86028 RepID=A0ABR4D3Z4_9HELO